MANTTLTVRTDVALKQQASLLFESMGMSLSTAINIFLRQAVNRGAYPCAIDSGMLAKEAIKTYPPHFFALFGTDDDAKMVEPEDLPLVNEDISL